MGDDGVDDNFALLITCNFAHLYWMDASFIFGFSCVCEINDLHRRFD